MPAFFSKRFAPCLTARLTLLLFGFSVAGAAAPSSLSRDLSLNGLWDVGIDRTYTQSSPVPGLAQDPAQVSPGTLWYRRTVALPPGDWSQATLILNGARFQPKVYLNGEAISSSEGGMAPTEHLLRGPAVAPGETITLEIALRSLTETDPRDASAVPSADRWRSNISSGLWDDVSLHLSGSRRLTRVTPWTDTAKGTLAIHWSAEPGTPASTAQAEIIDLSGEVLAQASAPSSMANGVVTVPLPTSLQWWTPEHPQLYRLRVTLMDNNRVQDTKETSWALKRFETRDLRLYLNNAPIQLRGGTIVWQRFVRTPDAGDVAFDTAWFKQHITDRLKAAGANTLRFHLGLPPERLLDLCDREGLMVQLEWPFFHGIAASVESMKAQWVSWLDVAMRHPSVMVIHPWNETEDPAGLRAGHEAIDALLPNYPPLVVAHQDTVHIHKYWWSLFENLGLYYDNAQQFGQTAIVDEFGGNYLDFKGNPGGYPATRESFLRFLGREQTAALRLEFQAESNARVGEYWRRLGVAGVLPFCALGGPQDGNSWFLGSLQNPEPMPVWDALVATFSPLSVSLDIWDRNYQPGQQIDLPLHLFNDTSDAATLLVEVRVVETGTGTVRSTQSLSASTAAQTHEQKTVTVTLPAQAGLWRLEAILKNPPKTVTDPVVSTWRVHTLAIKVPENLTEARIGVSENERELRSFLQQNGLTPVSLNDPSATLLVGAQATWEALKSSPELRRTLSSSLHRGASIALLDVGPRDLGEGYRAKALGTLDAAPRLRDPYSEKTELFDGIRVTFRQLPEPESHFHPAPENRDLWQGVPLPATWLWNGLRGGLVAPAADMDVSGLSQPAYLAIWKERGADIALIAGGEGYHAYRLANYYAFSREPKDKATRDTLRARVRLLAEDAPALQHVIDPDAQIEEIDLAAGYLGAAQGQADTLTPLASCGKSLTRSPIVSLSFGAKSQRLVLSQVLTAGRLVRGAAEPGFYGVRYDPAAEQFVLNLLAETLPHPQDAGQAGTAPR